MAESGWASSEEQAWIRFMMAIEDMFNHYEILVPSRLRTRNAAAIRSPGRGGGSAFKADGTQPDRWHMIAGFREMPLTCRERSAPAPAALHTAALSIRASIITPVADQHRRGQAPGIAPDSARAVAGC